MNLDTNSYGGRELEGKVILNPLINSCVVLFFFFSKKILNR